MQAKVLIPNGVDCSAQIHTFFFITYIQDIVVFTARL